VLRSRLTTIALVLVGIAATAFLAYALFAPRTLRIAVGPLGSSDLRVAVAFLQALQRERSGIRLKLVLTEGTTASAKAFNDKRADLAIVRSDIAMPEQSATVAIFRREATYFVARAGADVERIGELRGKRIGFNAQRPATEAVLTRILASYGLSVEDVTLKPGSPPEILQAAQDGEIDVIFVIAPITDRMSRRTLTAFPKQGEKDATILPVTEADAIVEQYPVFDTLEIVRGAFTTDPPRPEQAVTTLAVTHRLVARRTLDESLVSELTRLLFSLRLIIAAEASAAHQLELPSVEDRGAKLPIHAGTIAYVEGETKTFFERYGDWFYLGVMGFSLLGSAAAALYSRMNASRAPLSLDDDMGLLAALIEQVREAGSPERLAELREQARGLHRDTIRAVAVSQPDSDKVATLRFLLQELRELIEQRERELRIADDYRLT